MLGNTKFIITEHVPYLQNKFCQPYRHTMYCHCPASFFETPEACDKVQTAVSIACAVFWEFASCEGSRATCVRKPTGWAKLNTFYTCPFPVQVYVTVLVVLHMPPVLVLLALSTRVYHLTYFDHPKSLPPDFRVARQ